jgi:hypothetical protein
MDALLQRLKELDRDRFEGLVFQLLCERYPGAGIHRVDGAGALSLAVQLSARGLQVHVQPPSRRLRRIRRHDSTITPDS